MQRLKNSNVNIKNKVQRPKKIVVDAKVVVDASFSNKKRKEENKDGLIMSTMKCYTKMDR